MTIEGLHLPNHQSNQWKPLHFPLINEDNEDNVDNVIFSETQKNILYWKWMQHAYIHKATSKRKF